MNRSKPRVTIVGLGLIGGSIGLALRQAGVAAAVVGHDKDPNAGPKAKQLGAVDKTDWNLISACEQADLIILATPLSAIRPTLQAIGPHLQPGCVVMDTATLKGPVMAWAAEALPDQVHFVGGDPIIAQSVERQGGLEAARANLFQNGLFCLIPSPTATDQAVKLTSDLVAILGAQPLYVDAVEHDGMLAGVEHLPALLALALLDTMLCQPAWRELRKVAGTAFETGTHLASNDPTVYSDLLAANRDNLVRWIDNFSASLAAIRQMLIENEPEAITQRFQAAMEERQKWIQDRQAGLWEVLPTAEMPRGSSFLADALLGGLWHKQPKKEKRGS